MVDYRTRPERAAQPVVGAGAGGFLALGRAFVRGRGEGDGDGVADGDGDGFVSWGGMRGLEGGVPGGASGVGCGPGLGETTAGGTGEPGASGTDFSTPCPGAWWITPESTVWPVRAMAWK